MQRCIFFYITKKHGGVMVIQKRTSFFKKIQNVIENVILKRASIRVVNVSPIKFNTRKKILEVGKPI